MLIRKIRTAPVQIVFISHLSGNLPFPNSSIFSFNRLVHQTQEVILGINKKLSYKCNFYFCYFRSSREVFLGQLWNIKNKHNTSARRYAIGFLLDHISYWKLWLVPFVTIVCTFRIYTSFLVCRHRGLMFLLPNINCKRSMVSSLSCKKSTSFLY